MRAKWMAIGLVLVLGAGDALAGKPPIFKPDVPPSWTWDRLQIANQAVDLLFDKCPALSDYLTDIQQAAYNMEDMGKPIDAQFASPFIKLHHWNKVLRLDIFTVPNPKSALLKPVSGRAGDDFTFYMGAGDDPGIFLQTSHDEVNICGAKPTARIRVPGNKGLAIPDAFDLFIAVPGMKILKAL